MEMSKNMLSKQITYRAIYFIWALVMLTIFCLNLKGIVHFGYGMGDIFFGLAILCVTIIIGILFFIFKLADRKVLIFFCLLTLIFFILKLTILRGGISPWNGRIFFY
jgi:hypothetical protein